MRYSAPGFLYNPVWVGDSGTRPKNQNFVGLGLKIVILYFFAYLPSNFKNVKHTSLVC